MGTPIPANTAPLTVWAAAAATGGRIVRARDDGEAARGITTDSRAVLPGNAFVALRGKHYDGHDFLSSAVESGARLLIVENGRAISSSSVDVVEVADTLTAWGDLAHAHVRAWRRHSRDSRIFAITGSTGKTTTKELCAALLREVDGCHATAGNLNNRVGVPAMAFGLEPRHRFGVFEVGMSEPGEIARLGIILEADVGVITNVGIAHAQGLGGGRDVVAREKGDLFAGLSADAAAIVCFDDPAAMAQLARTRARRVTTFGLKEGADYRIVERAGSSFEGARVRIVRRREASELSVHLPLMGEGAALDFVAALGAVESVTGPLDADVIASALRNHLRRPPGRMQVRRLLSGTAVLDDAYNANPQSVRVALRTLSEVAQGRRGVVVLGEMRELGDVAAEEHSALGSAIVASGARLAVSCGGLADLAVQGAEQAGLIVARGRDAADAAKLAVGLVAEGDVVLVKASRGVGAETVVEALVRAGGGEAGQDGTSGALPLRRRESSEGAH
jgi:UDP-N-acetylmuramoyl-tripeptide--D-alanyl-D-alanine ligase